LLKKTLKKIEQVLDGLTPFKYTCAKRAVLESNFKKDLLKQPFFAEVSLNYLMINVTKTHKKYRKMYSKPK
jgi:hypothetical protein